MCSIYVLRSCTLQVSLASSVCVCVCVCAYVYVHIYLDLALWRRVLPRASSASCVERPAEHRGHHVLLRRALHSLHCLPTRLCAHMPSPPQSLQSLLTRLCWQMLAPPQSLQLLLWRLCWQMLAPPAPAPDLPMRPHFNDLLDLLHVYFQNYGNTRPLENGGIVIRPWPPRRDPQILREIWGSGGRQAVIRSV